MILFHDFKEKSIVKQTRCETTLISDELIDTNVQVIEFDLFYEFVEIELVYDKMIKIGCTNACVKHCTE